VKIKDIISEGIIGGTFDLAKNYVSNLRPEVFKKISDIPLRGNPDKQLTNKQAQAKADQMFAPGGEDDWGDEAEDKAEDNPKTKPSPKEIVVPKNRIKKPEAPKSPDAPGTPSEPDTPYNLSDEKLGHDERIMVNTPAGPMYKYPDGRWYQIPTTGIPTPVDSSYHDALNKYADSDGYIERVPPPPKPRKRR